MKTSTVVRRLAAAACTIALAGGVAACSSSAEPTGGLAVVVGGHSNMPSASLDGQAAAALDEALSAQSYFAMVVADGEPFVMDGAGTLTARDDNSQIQERDRERNRQAVDAMLAEATARSPETDLLTGLALAARSISSASGDHTIVVVDSGLSTAGALDFAAEPYLLDADPQELARSLAAAGELPDLSGIRVVFQGLGDTVAPQPAFGQRQRDNLVAIWEAVLRAAKATDVVVEETPLSGKPDTGLPYVTPVIPGPAPSCTVETVILDEQAVAFVADTADFVDRERVLATLRPIKERIEAEGLAATLTGTTADVGDQDGQRDLSLQRAEAVAKELSSPGVASEQLTVVGMGSDFEGYDAGNLAANRKVTVALAAAKGISCQSA